MGSNMSHKRNKVIAINVLNSRVRETAFPAFWEHVLYYANYKANKLKIHFQSKHPSYGVAISTPLSTFVTGLI